MNLLIMGPAGSGKGTMSAHIIQMFDIAHISTGDMFREAIANGTPVGKEAKVYLDAGKFVPDDVTNRMVKERILQDDCKNGFLLDGFPRNLDQANALDSIMAELGLELDAILNLEVPYSILVSRITGRRICKDCGAIYHIDNHPSKAEGICDVCGGELYQRSDDTEEKLKVRFDEYKQQTEPVIDFYRNKGIVHDIDAAGSADDVMDEIQSILEATR